MLKRASEIYPLVDEEKRERLLNACYPIIDRLVGEVGDRVFLETLVVGGKDFLDSLYGEGTEVATDYDAEIIFS